MYKGTVCILIQLCRFLVINSNSMLVLYVALLIQTMLKDYEECGDLAKNNFIKNSNNIYIKVISISCGELYQQPLSVNMFPFVAVKFTFDSYLIHFMKVGDTYLILHIT